MQWYCDVELVMPATDCPILAIL